MTEKEEKKEEIVIIPKLVICQMAFIDLQNILDLVYGV